VLRLVADAVVTADGHGTVLRPGAVDISAGRIARVGDPAAPVPRGGRVRAVGGLLMPGLVNTHAHSPMTLLRSAGDGLALDRWLREAIWPREGALQPDDIYWGMALGASELLENGVTTTCEMYFGNDALVAAARDAGIRLVATPGIFDLPGGGTAGSWQSFLESARALHRDHHDPEGGVTVGLGPHSAYALPVEGLVACAEAARAADALLHLHVAETAGEDAAVRQAHGCGIPELLEQLGVLECRVLAAHSVWMDDADLDLAAEAALEAAYLCAGQSCTAGERFLVHSAVRAEFVERVVEATAARVRLGDPFDPRTTMGPLNNEATAAKFDQHVADAVSRGAKLCIGGSREHGRPTTLYAEATVLDGVTREMAIAQEETFGPVVPVLEVASMEEAIALTNSTPFGLTAAVFTADLERGLAFAEAVRAGWVNINASTNLWESHLPFGGRSGSVSGRGRVGGRSVMDTFTEPKTVVFPAPRS